MKFATVGRAMPRESATWSCVHELSVMSCLNARAFSIGLRSRRWMFSTRASSSIFLSSTLRMTTGTRARPASFAARQRRSPATI